MKTHRIMGLFSNFKEAFAVVDGIKRNEVPGVTLDGVSTMSPIEHPEIDEVLEGRAAAA